MLRSQVLSVVCASAILACIGAAVFAQVPASPAFEVASIKPNGSERDTGGMRIAGGRFTATNVAVRNLIVTAYSTDRPLLPVEIVGGPDWVIAERFDIEATASVPLANYRQVAPLLRALLEERFKLRAHQEPREQQVFALTVARSDGRLGSHLKASTLHCTAARGDGAPLQPRPVQPSCGVMIAAGSLAAGDMTISNLARFLSGQVQRVVVDQTNLAGAFDLDLRWKPDQPTGGDQPDDRTSIFTAVQEQLGLKLQPTKAVIEVVVIDHVEHPTEN